MPRRNRIQEAWQSYKNAVVPAGAPAIQIQESRRAFYAGAAAAFGVYVALGGDIAEDEAVKVLEDLKAEIDEFPKLVLKGRA